MLIFSFYSQFRFYLLLREKTRSIWDISILTMCSSFFVLNLLHPRRCVPFCFAVSAFTFYSISISILHSRLYAFWRWSSRILSMIFMCELFFEIIISAFNLQSYEIFSIKLKTIYSEKLELAMMYICIAL